MQKTDLQKNVFLVVGALLLLFLLPPFFFTERYNLNIFNKQLSALILSLLFITYYKHLKFDTRDLSLIGFVGIQSVLIFNLSFVHYIFGYQFESGYVDVAIQVLVCLALLMLFIGINEVKLLARILVNVFLCVGFLGSIIFILGLTNDIEFIDTFGGRPYYDFGLTYSNIFYQIGGMKVIRISGFFDEPGTFAFYNAFALVLARIYGFGFRKEFLLVVFGLLTLSLAFFIISIIWFVFTIQLRYKALSLIAILVFSLTFQINSPEREEVFHWTFSRLAPTDDPDRLIKGDNRSAIMKSNLVAFKDAVMIGHGLNYKKNTKGRYVRGFIGNPVGSLAKHGIIGCLFVYMHVFLLIWLIIVNKKLSIRNKAVIGLTIVLMLLQRPTPINGFGFLFFLLMVYPFSSRKLN